MAPNEYAFRAQTVEAYTIKSLAEVLQNILVDICFVFDKTGIRLTTIDQKKPSNYLVVLHMGNEQFDEYHCPKPVKVGVNLQHLHKMTRNIKKKDGLILFIKKNEPGLLGLTTIQNDINRPMVSHIKIQKNISEVEAVIPTDYGHPIHIPTNVYQKLCKDMQSISKQITIFSKGSYIRFNAESEGLFMREVPFGELDETDQTTLEYEDVFYTKSLSQLIKVSGLNSKIQIYVPPTNTEYDNPLKISINTGQLGRLDIYIRSIRQIEEELE